MSCDIAYMQNLNKNDINEIIYKAETDLLLENKLMATGREDFGGRYTGSLGLTGTHCYI